MRLLIALPDSAQAVSIREHLQHQPWEIEIAACGTDVLRQQAAFDLILMHHCLPGLDGLSIGNAIASDAPLCPPRILLVCPAEFLHTRPCWADVIVQAGVSIHRLCLLLTILAQKPLPNLAAAHASAISHVVETFLNELSLPPHFKGSVYIAWLLERLIPSPLMAQQPLSASYSACAKHFQVTPASVERCVRIAVESVFTQGSMRAIERYFGATVDPERGKPTNRAFLLQASEQLRLRLLHSRTADRSPNSSEMHHRPAAPTSV